MRPPITNYYPHHTRNLWNKVKFTFLVQVKSPLSKNCSIYYHSIWSNVYYSLIIKLYPFDTPTEHFCMIHSHWNLWLNRSIYFETPSDIIKIWNFRMMAYLLEIDWTSINPDLNGFPENRIERFLKIYLGIVVWN